MTSDFYENQFIMMIIVMIYDDFYDVKRLIMMMTMMMLKVVMPGKDNRCHQHSANPHY